MRLLDFGLTFDLMEDFIIKIIRLEKIDSTNRYALDGFANFADNTLIIADEQEAGRGRRGKSWISPPGMNLYASYIVKTPSFPIGRAMWCGGLATLITLSELAPDSDLWLKWPNDVCCSCDKDGIPYRKIAGLLAETWSPADSNKLEGVVVGIGVDLNMPKEILETIDQPATSVVVETGNEVDIADFAEKLFENLLKFRRLAESDPEKFFKVWATANGLKGKTIKIRLDDGSLIEGTVAGVNEEGALLLKKEDGEINTVISGELQ